MMRILKNRVMLLILCLGIVSPVSYAGDNAPQIGQSLISRFITYRIAGMSHVSRLISFFPGGSVASGVGMLSCLGLGFGSAFFLPQTIALGVSCSVGYFGLFGHALLNQLLQKTNIIDQTTTEHRKEFNEYRVEFESHTKKMEKNHQKITESVIGVEKKVDGLTSQSQYYHQENVDKFTVLESQNKAIQRSITDVESGVEVVGKDVKNVHNNLHQLSEKTEILRHQVVSNGEKAQERDDVINNRLSSMDLQIGSIQNCSQKNHEQITITANKILDEQEELKQKQLAINEALKNNEETLKKMASSQDQISGNVAYLVQVKEEEIRRDQERRQSNVSGQKRVSNQKVSSPNIQEIFNELLPHVNPLDGQMNSGYKERINSSHRWHQ